MPPDLRKLIHSSATARDPSALSFRNTTPENYLPLKLDVTSASDIESAFSSTLEKFKRVDVVVNNAGYGLSGPFEELEEKHVRTQMEVNFFGLMAVTKKAMEVMREQRPSGGLIQQVTSIGGQNGVPNFSIYCASKWVGIPHPNNRKSILTPLCLQAVEGFTESVSHEVKPEWKIKFQLIEPGGFRTDWSGRSMVFADKRHPAYEHLDARKKAEGRHHQQAGDPIKGAKAMYELAVMENPPLRVVIGTDAYQAVMKKINAYSENYKKYEQISNSTDVDHYHGEPKEEHLYLSSSRKNLSNDVQHLETMRRCEKFRIPAALTPDSRTADLFPQSLPNLGAVTNASNALVKNQSSTALRERTGCFQAHPSLRTVTPQDALVALGRLAFPRDFYDDKYYYDETVLRRFRSASIVLTKVNVGGDAFSMFNVASQVIEIIKFCIVQETPQNWFGGLLEVGSLNRFRVVVHGLSP
ncbi:MAG: hypothetical protein LQ345_005834 [Seirophora villosa]|nr:MAG: hypothetical protein LQ345_005834 [Seirophora villosa]